MGAWRRLCCTHTLHGNHNAVTVLGHSLKPKPHLRREGGIEEDALRHNGRLRHLKQQVGVLVGLIDVANGAPSLGGDPEATSGRRGDPLRIEVHAAVVVD